MDEWVLPGQLGEPDPILVPAGLAAQRCIGEHGVGEHAVGLKGSHLVLEGEPLGFGELRAQVGDENHPAPRTPKGFANGWHREGGEHAGEERTWANGNDLSGTYGINGLHRGGYVRRLDPNRVHRTCSGDRDLPLDGARGTLRHQGHWNEGGRQDPPSSPEHLPSSGQTFNEVARGIYEASQHEVAEHVAFELTGEVAVAEGVSSRSFGAEGYEALSDVPEGHHPEQLAQTS